jgi:hypothetical protein
MRGEREPSAVSSSQCGRAQATDALVFGVLGCLVGESAIKASQFCRGLIVRRKREHIDCSLIRQEIAHLNDRDCV